MNPAWYYRLKLEHALTKKLKVGFGPVIEGEYNIGVRGSRIDPIVNTINKQQQRRVLGSTFSLIIDEMERFDLIVIVKEFHSGLYAQIDTLRAKGKAFLFDIVDNPFCTDPRSESYHDHPEFFSIDGRRDLLQPLAKR